jgi:Holliday junction resolvase YEN1
LISLSIHPIFVFDGPNKPPFKRNKRTGHNVASIPEFLAKQLLKQFAFPIHLAPGEAEAECALLQREGIVDAVLSEDVDTLMFGSGLTIRNWSPEQKTGKTPTHVNAYDAVQTKNGPAGLDREGMILIALMSGGDYIPEGIPGCGPKTACEAARAGFGSDLCKIATNDKKSMQEWRDRLAHELKTNESKLFSRKKPSLKIPDNFPPREILGYYTHPAISSQAGLDKLKRSIKWDQDLDFSGLREFAGDAFDWVKLEGAKHFIRSLAPPLLVRHLRMRGEQADRLPSDNVQAIEEDEALLVKGIHGKRQHAVTDSTTELRVSFTPIELVKVDLSNEEPDEEFEAGPPVPDADIDDDLPLDDEDDAEGPKKRGPTKFDPSKPARVWVLETFVKVGVPLKVQDWEAERLKPLKAKRTASANDASKPAPKPRGMRRAKTANDAPQTTMEQFAKVTKPGAKLSQALSKLQNTSPDPPAPSHPTPQPAKIVIDLLFSSPVMPTSIAPRPVREKSPSPVLPELPSSVTRRRKRTPIQRAHTLPSLSATSLGRPDIPPLDTIESLDLVDSPGLPSPLPVPAKRPRTKLTRNAPTTRSGYGILPTKQTTLDAWRPTLPTPLESRKDILSSEPPPSLHFKTAPDGIDTLDLTLSSPIHPPYPPPTNPTQAPINPRRTIADVFSATRPPLGSISSNTSQQCETSSTTRSTRSSKPKPKSKPKSKSPPLTSTSSTRRTSPRLRKIRSPSLEMETLGFTEISRSPEIESLDLTRPPSPPPPATTFAPHPPPTTTQVPTQPPLPRASSSTTSSLRSSPRLSLNSNPSLSASLSTATSTSPSPPPQAAWKSQAKKKRQVVMRKSLLGAWKYVDEGGESSSPEKVDAKGRVTGGKRDRRRWDVSSTEYVDMT